MLGSTRRMLDLAQWAVAALQTVSQAAPVSSAALPPALSAVFGGLAALQVQGLLLSSACLGEYAFTTEVGIMGTALALALVAGVVAVAGSHAPSWVKTLGGFAMRATLLLFPMVAKESLTLLYCVDVTLAASAASGLDGGPAFVATSAPFAGLRGSNLLVTLPLLISNPLYVCWAAGGSHRPAGTPPLSLLLLSS